MQQLQKSVSVPASRHPWYAGVLALFTLTVLVSLIVSALHGFAMRQERQAYADAFQAQRERADRLEHRLLEMQSALGPSVTATDLRLSHASASVERLSCRLQPDVLVHPVAVAEEHRWFTASLSETVTNAHGTRFAPGESCRVGGWDFLRVTRHGSLYVLRPARLPNIPADAWSCPTGAYRLVSDRNLSVRQAVEDACDEGDTTASLLRLR